ncbi:Flagellar biosynthesis/type III secretory pathway protein FliH [Marinospirillum celere]|uniref:Flagellar assembly protein FliH n=1 Tax=Marinospirillum celere TaxID=1122252 RepID=A0A1I1H0A9_9GAMM|nr:flagellar assembly protein FliH [Marinospirillum celere]SFC17569.1 Flagellar biosynthesis/type III secretory pathway protein FliH [Marinospirillum celere]
MPHRKRIPANEKVPFERWEMPDLTGVRKRIAQRLDELKEEEQGEAEEKAPSPPTEEEIQAIREEARSEGYAAGFSEGQAAGTAEGRAQGYQEGEAQGQQAGLEAGYQQGLEQAQHEIDQQLARLQSLIQQLQGPINALDQDVEAGLLSLVDLISRALLRREISIDRDFLGEVLREAVAALPSGHERLRIFINPEDLPLVEAIRHELLEDYRLVTDPKITPGGVRVETLQSLVDCTLENRYKKVIDSLLDAGYQQVDQDFSPLSRDVLAEPEAAPLQEPTQPEPEPEQEPEVEAGAPDAEEDAGGVDPEDYPHQEYKAPELAEQKPTEPVAKVSLQRGSAPRHLPPLDEASDEAPAEAEEPQPTEPTPAKPSQAPELNQEEAASAEPDESPEPEENQDPAPAPEEPLADEDVSEHEDFPEEVANTVDQEEAVPEAEPPLTDEDEDDFFEQLLGENQEASASAPQNPEHPNPEPESEQEKVWAPESVHEVRYLDDPDAVMESTWEKDFQDEDANAGTEEAETDESTAGNPEEALDELLKFEEDEDSPQDASTDDDQGGKYG